MPVESAADRAVFLNADEFGIEVTYERISGGDVITLTGIFDEPVVEAVQLDRPGISSVEPSFLMRSADLPDDATKGDPGDRLTVNDTTYEVREHQPDGTGMVRLVLEAV